MSKKDEKSNLTETEIKAKMRDAIDEMHNIVMEGDTENKKAYAANALSGLVSRYKEMFGFDDETESKLRSVKNF